MSDRVLRPRVRSGPAPLSFSENREKWKSSSSRRHQKEVEQNLLNTVAQERLSMQSLRKKVVFSNKRYTSDDLVNGRLPSQGLPEHSVGQWAAGDDGVVMTPVGILKRPPQMAVQAGEEAAKEAAKALAEDVDVTPASPRRQRANAKGRGSARGSARGAGRVSRKALHESFTAEEQTSPWRSASSSIVAALALAMSPLARSRAKQAERVARDDETVRRVVDFYKGSGEYWNVFPKTDYTYSPLSRFNREISPGVRTLPNMSRRSLRSTSSFQYRFSAQSFSSDSEDEPASAHLSQEGRLSLWKRANNMFWAVLISTVTAISSVFRSVTFRAHSADSQEKYHFKPRSYHPHNTYQEKSIWSKIWYPFHWLFSKSYMIVSQTLLWDVSQLNSTRTSWKLHTTSRRKIYLWILPLILLSFLGWWLREDVYVGVHAAVSSLATIFTPLFGSAASLLYDICMSPLWLLQNIWNQILSFGWKIIYLCQMLLSLFVGFKERTLGTSDARVLTETNIESDFLKMKVHLDLALQQQEASLLAKIAENNEYLHASLSEMSHLQSRLKEKEGVHQTLHAKVSFLQDELRRLRRRISTCCSRPVTSAARPEESNLQENLQQLLSTPKGSDLLRTAVTNSISQDASLLNMPPFNDTEIRAWASNTFLDKDDLEKSLQNVTKYFHEELDRNSASFDEEINNRIENQMQYHLSHMSKLQLKLSDSNQFQHDHLQTSASFSSGGTAAALDESRVLSIVENALSIYDADKTGMADYALESQGGQVISTRCTETYQVKSPTLSVFGVPLWYPSNSPRTVIQPGMHPGECWAFVGSQGYLVIELSHRIRVKGFTYEHISPVLLPTGKMDSAPKDFSVHGLRSEGDMEPILLGNYRYMENGTSMQYFPVQHSSLKPLKLIEVQVKSNHGNINYTCMYRFRVHGSIA